MNEDCPFDTKPESPTAAPSPAGCEEPSSPRTSVSTPRFRLREKLRSNLSLSRLLRELGLPPSDVILVGDGSGTGSWTMGAGWACAVINTISNERILVAGGWSCGSVMIAELSAYLQGLMTFEALYGAATRKYLGRNITVTILTDNQAITQQHHTAFSGLRTGGDCNPIWAALRELCRSGGYILRFQHIPRVSIALNHVCDELAGQARKTNQAVVEEESLDQFEGDLDSWNP